MGYLFVHGVSRGAWRRLGWAMGGVVLIATILGFVGWAAATSLSAWRHIEGVDAQDIGRQTSLTTGVIGIAAAFLYLGIHG